MTNMSNNKKRKRQMAREPKTEVAAVQENTVGQDVPAQEEKGSILPKKSTKTEKVLSLLKRTEGATLDEMVEVTGWLPHTTRAALTGLKKKGHTVVSEKVDSVRTYRVASNASA
jgi:hypothetical protein